MLLFQNMKENRTIPKVKFPMHIMDEAKINHLDIVYFLMRNSHARIFLAGTNQTVYFVQNNISS